MNTRQIRLNHSEEIHNRMKEFIGKKINIVLHDSMVFFGVLKSMSENEIILVNMRMKKKTVSINTIRELFIDMLE